MSAKKAQRSTFDSQEVAAFEALGENWWDETGPMGPLHQMNPARIQYILESAALNLKQKSLKGLCVIDIGCGAGILAEPLTRLGAHVMGIDAGAKNIRIAREHAETQNLDIAYKTATVEEQAKGTQKFDIVIASEIIEHVADPAYFLACCRTLLKKDGILILSTINRNPKSYLFGIVAAEYLLRWLPVGTHDWKKFMRPSEVAKMLAQSGLSVRDISGIVYDPLKNTFGLNREDLGLNYILTAAPH